MTPEFIKNIPFKHYPWFLSIQFVNLVFPFITYPYLLRNIGPEKFGLIAMAASAGAIVTAVSEFGSTFTGVRDVSRLSDDREALSVYYWTSLTVRMFLFSLCVIIIAAVFVFSPTLRRETLLFTLTIALYVPAAVVPSWLFIGLQRVRQYNVFIVGGKILSLGLLFLFVTVEEDYSVYPVILLIPAFLNMLLFAGYAKEIGIRYVPVPLHAIRNYLREGYYPFISQSMTSLYTQINPLLLMTFTGNPVFVGYYAVAEKIVQLIKSLIAPINQLYLPVISRSFAASSAMAMNEVRNFAGVIGVIGASASAATILLADELVVLVGGISFGAAAAPLRALSPVILFVALNNIAGVHVLLNIKRQREFFFGIAIGMMVNVFLLYTLLPALAYQSPAWSWSVAEGIVLLYYYIIIRMVIRK